MDPPPPRQDGLADLLLDAATRAAIDDSIAAGEGSFAEHGGKPPAEAFERIVLIRPLTNRRFCDTLVTLKELKSRSKQGRKP